MTLATLNSEPVRNICQEVLDLRPVGFKPLNYFPEETTIHQGPDFLQVILDFQKFIKNPKIRISKKTLHFIVVMVMLFRLSHQPLRSD